MIDSPPAKSFRMRRLLALAVVGIAAATALTTLALPAPPASALRIDCSYTTGMAKYIEDAKIKGVECAQKASGGASGPSKGGTGGTGTTGGGSGPSCVPLYSNVPSGFFADVALHDGPSSWSSSDRPDGTSVGIQKNFIDNVQHSEIAFYKFKTASGGFALKMTFKLWNGDQFSVASFSTDQKCDTGFSFISTVGGGPMPEVRELVAPGVAVTPASGRVETRGIMAPVASVADQYLLRLDVTNPSAATITTPAFVSVGFGRSFDLVSIASIPSDTDCEIIATTIEQCTLPELAPGETRTLTFLTQAKPGLSADIELPLSVTALGSGPILIETFPGVTQTKRTTLPLTNFYSIRRPSALVPPAAPTKPECAIEGAPTEPSATPGSASQNVIAGQATQLDMHCTTTGGLPMTATALHGTATLDAYGNITYTPDASYRGLDTITVVASNPDTGVVSEATSFDVNVIAPAEATADAYSLVKDTAFTASTSILANDRVPETAGWMVQQGATPPAHGTLALDPHTGTFTYTPTTGYVGTDSFLYRLSGPDGAASNVVAVTFTIQAG